MTRYQRPYIVDALAASYVMASMSARSRRRFEQIMSQHAEVARAVSFWSERAAPLALSLPAPTLSSQSWERLATTIGLVAEPALPPQPRWWQRWLAPLPAGALAAGLLLGMVLPTAWQVWQTQSSDMQLPESYVGVLATEQGKPGLIVSSLRQGTVVDLKVLTPVPVPTGHRLHLWRIDKDGVPTALGALPAEASGKILRLTLSEPAEKTFFTAVELAVSIEAGMEAPSAPSVPFVYRGLCGKVWK